MSDQGQRAGVNGVRHVNFPAVRRLPSGLEVPCDLGAIEFAADGETVICSDCKQEVTPWAK